jgi:hypothetical protein
MAVKLKAPKDGAVTGMVVKEVAVSDLVPYANNPRKNDEQVPRMVELIKKFGFKVPILVRGNRVVDGHLRLKAAMALGLTTLPAIDVGDMPDAEERALRIVLNKSVEWAKWDEDLLAKEMKVIMGDGLDLSLTGFDASTINRLVKQIAEPLPSPPPPVTKTKDADAGLPADPTSVSISFQMSDKNRSRLLAALEAYRAQHTLTNHSQAVLALAVKWAEEAGVTLPKV